MANLKSTFFCNSVESMTLWLTSHPLSQSSNPSQELNQDHLCIGKSEKLFNTESTMQTELWTDWMVTQKLRYVLPDLSARQVKQCSLFLSGGQLHLLLLSFSDLYGVYDSMDDRLWESAVRLQLHGYWLPIMLVPATRQHNQTGQPEWLHLWGVRSIICYNGNDCPN